MKENETFPLYRLLEADRQDVGVTICLTCPDKDNFVSDKIQVQL